jgi:hypothetical protein
MRPPGSIEAGPTTLLRPSRSSSSGARTQPGQWETIRRNGSWTFSLKLAMAIARIVGHEAGPIGSTSSHAPCDWPCNDFSTLAAIDG